MSDTHRSASRNDTKAYLVGGGIAALASAAYLIRDGGIPGAHISILEQTSLLGGSLDGAGSPDHGYVIRGGRMFTYEAYTCTFDLLSFIPSLTDRSKTVSDEIHAFNEKHIPESHARLVRGGAKVDVSTLGFSNQDRLDLIELMAVSESSLGAKRIEDVFAPSFFQTNFWYMWVTTFAFQPWHSAVELKRYLHRFIQEFPRIHTLGGVRRTPYNQYDSIVLPLTTWLKAQGVRFETGVRVTDLDFKYGPRGKGVERLHVVRDGTPGLIAVGDDDLVFVTNGSMTSASSLGSMTRPAELSARDGKTDGSWALWETLAKKHAEFGRPEVFNSKVDESKWLSFTVTMRDPTFFDLMEKFTGNAAGTGGLVTFTDSNWLMSVVLAAQPHFIGQPDNIKVFWGYGLFVDQVGNFVRKKMSECSSAEDLDRTARPSAFQPTQVRDTRDVELHSLHDALHHQPVHATGQGRPPRSPAGRHHQPRLHRTVLRNSRRRGVYRGIFGARGADGGDSRCSISIRRSRRSTRRSTIPTCCSAP